ncbi:hypothetical protein H310_09939 [Aphanomyces invadans]|uniref:Uncharacterized protein n=1 Tax=Aphanomyces invadans TaxID=157072 RepID=A0A024TSK2_9STRA|nr:hypothetical protein H310_09939 [Aphanomyces invadans]ETV97135.1 hypothetical protein H310_09939 [Aphanomyces invadans]|eukprot:XP_008874381.1 hypothetical protein H310_09939 [Aphanomyces invadans]
MLAPLPLAPSKMPPQRRMSFTLPKSLAAIEWTRLRHWAASKSMLWTCSSADSSTSLLLDDTDTDDDVSNLHVVRPRGKSDPLTYTATTLLTSWRSGNSSHATRHSTSSCM